MDLVLAAQPEGGRPDPGPRVGIQTPVAAGTERLAGRAASPDDPVRLRQRLLPDAEERPPVVGQNVRADLDVDRGGAEARQPHPRRARDRTPGWTIGLPPAALALGLAGEAVLHGAFPGSLFAPAVPVLLGWVFSAVHHAEVVALRMGQPFGSLLLAVTVIEVALIVSVLLSAPGGESAVARDTVPAAIMIAAKTGSSASASRSPPWR